MLLSLVYLFAAFCASRDSFGPNSAMFPRSYCGRNPAAFLNAWYSSFSRLYRTARLVYSSLTPIALAAIASRLTLRSAVSICRCFCVASYMVYFLPSNSKGGGSMFSNSSSVYVRSETPSTKGKKLCRTSAVCPAYSGYIAVTA